jgi:hypothetical protein
MDQEGWREASFDQPPDEQERAGAVRRLHLRWVAAGMVAISVVVFLASRSRAVFRCHQDCFGDPPLDRYGSLTYEPGHAWTRYADSWQWSAQHGLAQFAVVASLIGLGLALTARRNPLPAFVLTIVGLAAWTVWVLLAPPIP